MEIPRGVPCLEVAEVRQGRLSIGYHSVYTEQPLRDLIRLGDICDIKTSLVPVCWRGNVGVGVGRGEHSHCLDQRPENNDGEDNKKWLMSHVYKVLHTYLSF